MSNPEINIELIERYLLESATTEERKLVEEKLASDESFAKLFSEVKILITGIQKSSRNEILSQLQAVEAEIKKGESENNSSNVVSINKKHQKEKKLWQPISIAAGILLLIGVIWFLKPFEKDNNQLASFYEPLPPELLYNFVRSENKKDNNKQAKAAKALMNDDISSATSLLTELIFSDGNSLDTMENTIRVYSNLLIIASKKDCNKNNQLFEDLKLATKGTQWQGTVLIDQALLTKKCDLNGLNELSNQIDSFSLSAFDSERWATIKKGL